VLVTGQSETYRLIGNSIDALRSNVARLAKDLSPSVTGTESEHRATAATPSPFPNLPSRRSAPRDWLAAAPGGSDGFL